MRKILFLLILTSSLLSAQKISSHKYFFDKYHGGGNNKGIEINPYKSYKNPAPRKSELSSTVFGFLPDWEYFSDSRQYLRLDLLTHVAIFGWTVDSTGTLNPPLGWPWTDFISLAHQSGVKVVMTVISFDDPVSHKILTDSAVKETLINNIGNVISQSNLDGVNLDFEELYEPDRGNPVNQFTAELNNFLPSEKEVSYDVPMWNWGGWDFAGLADAADYLFIMGYDVYGAWSSVAGPSAPLTGGYINIYNSLTSQDQFGSVTQNSPEKLILGVPYYGNHWKTDTENESSDILEFVGAISYRTIEAGYSWNTEKWSDVYQTPWFSWAADTTNQMWFDNDSSLALKYDFAESLNLKGVGLWALGFDGNRTELWDLINNKFGSGAAVRPTPPVEFSVTQSSDSEAKISFSSSPDAESYLLYIGDDGTAFTDSVVLYSSPYNFPVQQNRTYYFKLCAVNSSGKSLPTHTLAVSVPAELSKKIMIVDGFDRYYRNNNKFNLIIRYAKLLNELGFGFSSSNNESVILGGVNLEDYDDVIYFLGNESRATQTVNFFEQNKIKSFLTAGSGRSLFISGSEIGYDIGDEGYSTAHDLDFYHNTLGAEYVSDSPAGESFTYYDIVKASGSPIYFGYSIDDGTHGTFDVGYPDAIAPYGNNGIILAQYDGTPSGSGFAAISHENSLGNRVVYFGFPFETIFPESARKELLSNVLKFMHGETSVDAENGTPEKFELFQNYPNPFNPTTIINFGIPKSGKVVLSVYNMLGQKVAELLNAELSAGYHSITFDAGELSSGIYIYKLTAGEFTASKKAMLLK